MHFLAMIRLTFSKELCLLDVVTWSNHCDVSLREWGPPFPLISSKIAFDECVCWLSFNWCIFYWFEWVIQFFLTHWPLGNMNEILDVLFKWILVIDGWDITCAIALIWMSLDFTDDQSTLVQVVAWCQICWKIKQNKGIWTFIFSLFKDKFSALLKQLTRWLNRDRRSFGPQD